MTSMARSPQEGQSVWLGGLAVAIKISSRQTGRAFSLVECTLEPGRLVPPHVHTREDEYTYVLEGESGLSVGDQIIQATAGCRVVKTEFFERETEAGAWPLMRADRTIHNSTRTANRERTDER